jgi:glycosyltransferase involved in cell wall biosynthesis
LNGPQMSSIDMGLSACRTLPVTVVICAYTEDRWQQTRGAVASVLAQSPPPEQMILVIDHNSGLAERARRELSGVTVLESEDSPGLSGARNTGLRKASQSITAFLDDDAEARPDWLSSLVEPYSNPKVVATGGSVWPRWPVTRPNWLPPTFDWVVGCSYVGLPQVPSAVRNPIGANMSVRTDAALEAGAFDGGIGRVGVRPRGCEETELAIRLANRRPGSMVWYVPAATVDHHVHADRLRFSYFVRRCWHEGQSKAYVVRLAGASAGLQSERRHAAVVIPVAIISDLRTACHGHVMSLVKVGAMLTGIAVTALGYLAGSRRAIPFRPARDGSR